jgi:hypothetical protein
VLALLAELVLVAASRVELLGVLPERDEGGELRLAEAADDLPVVDVRVLASEGGTMPMAL